MKIQLKLSLLPFFIEKLIILLHILEEIILLFSIPDFLRLKNVIQIIFIISLFDKLSNIPSAKIINKKIRLTSH